MLEVREWMVVTIHQGKIELFFFENSEDALKFTLDEENEARLNVLCQALAVNGPRGGAGVDKPEELRRNVG